MKLQPDCGSFIGEKINLTKFKLLKLSKLDIEELSKTILTTILRKYEKNDFEKNML